MSNRITSRHLLYLPHSHPIIEASLQSGSLDLDKSFLAGSFKERDGYRVSGAIYLRTDEFLTGADGQCDRLLISPLVMPFLGFVLFFVDAVANNKSNASAEIYLDTDKEARKKKKKGKEQRMESIIL